jgi:hypothetical protein
MRYVISDIFHASYGLRCLFKGFGSSGMTVLVEPSLYILGCQSLTVDFEVFPMLPMIPRKRDTSLS